MKNNIDILFEKAEKHALKEVEKMARNILKKHKHLNMFVMAMGTYFFVDNDGENVDTKREVYVNYKYSYQDSFLYFQPLNDFMDKYDTTFKLTGNPMKFTATGKKIKNW